jgi:hypothetical protein
LRTLVAAGRHRYSPDHLIASYDGQSWKQISRGPYWFEGFWAGRGEIVGTDYNGSLWRGDASGVHREPLYPSRGEIEAMVSIDGAIYTVGELFRETAPDERTRST